jgi:hypothetical protein
MDAIDGIIPITVTNCAFLEAGMRNYISASGTQKYGNFLKQKFQIWRQKLKKPTTRH